MKVYEFDKKSVAFVFNVGYSSSSSPTAQCRLLLEPTFNMEPSSNHYAYWFGLLYKVEVMVAILALSMK